MVRLRVDGDHSRCDDLCSGRRRIAREGECQYGHRDRGDRENAGERQAPARGAPDWWRLQRGAVTPSARRRRRRHLEGGILCQDGALESLELRPGLEPELPGEQAPAVTVGLERLALSTAAVEGQHRLPAQALPQRVRGDEGVELPADLAVTAEAEQRLEPVLRRREPHVIEAADLIACEVLECELGQRRATPDRERLVEDARRLRR